MKWCLMNEESFLQSDSRTLRSDTLAAIGKTESVARRGTRCTDMRSLIIEFYGTQRIVYGVISLSSSNKGSQKLKIRKTVGGRNVISNGHGAIQNGKERGEPTKVSSKGANRTQQEKDMYTHQHGNTTANTAAKPSQGKVTSS